MSDKPQILVTAGDAVVAALSSFGGNRTALKDKFPFDAKANARLAMSRFSPRTRRLGMSDQMVDAAHDAGQEALIRLYKAAESPIERALAPWLIFADYGPKFLTVPPIVNIPKEDGGVMAGDLVIVPQFAFAKYRVDFMIVGVVGRARHMVAVECDGQEYHDPQKDRERDAYFRSWGIATVRATGEQIYTSPQMVAGRVSDALSHATE